MLQNAGIDVQAGLLAEEAIQINRDFFHYQKTGIPFVTLKCAMTLDGKIATHTGDSCWISSDASRKLVHELRAKSGAILCGIGTALKDDPLFNARPESKFPRQPLRILLDSKLRLPESSRLVQTADQFSTIIVVTQPQSAEKQRRFEKRGIEILRISADTIGRISIPDLMKELGKRGVVQMLVEGGGEVHASFLEEQCAHKLLWFVAPLLLGGKDAPTPVGGVGKDKIADAIAVDHLRCRSVGADYLFEGSPVYR
jgi:diaminohydroxyphosphoribosylaminopyrimidine deaminase/5-amino-6-(5-phosphoribosylamino)uracil reductase